MISFDLRNFLRVDDCNMDELLESSWHLVTRYQESQGLLAVFFNQTFTLGNVDLGANLFIDHRRIILFFACYFNSEILPIYGTF